MNSIFFERPPFTVQKIFAKWREWEENKYNSYKQK